MSLVEFADNFPPTQELKDRFTEEQKISRDKSAVVLLADKLAKAGSQGLKDLVRELEAAGYNKPLWPPVFRTLPSEKILQVQENLAAIVFGVTVSSLEDTLITGGFDAKYWCDKYNIEIMGTSLTNVEVKPSFKDVPGEKLEKMYECARTDKTFSAFFEPKDMESLMPELLFGLIDSSDALPHIRRAVLPVFTQRAKYLTTQS